MHLFTSWLADIEYFKLNRAGEGEKKTQQDNTEDRNCELK